MKKLLLVLSISLVLTFVGCNKITRQFGGTVKIELERNEKFLNVTWKKNNIWVLVKNAETNEYIFKEYSNLGILQGKVIITEK